MTALNHPAETIRAFLCAVAVSATAVVAVATATIAAQPGDMVAVLFPTGGTDGLTALAASAMVVDSAWSGAIIVAVPETADFADTARASGALALIPLPRGGGCFTPKR